MRNKKAFTLVEVVIASTIFIMFLGGGFAIYLQGQDTISKSTWINNSTRDEGLAIRELAELSKASSYPSKILQNSIKVNENLKAQTKTPLSLNASMTIDINSDEYILGFPICTPITDNDANGTIKWVTLRLNKVGSTNGRTNLILAQTLLSIYSDPDKAKGFNSNDMGSTKTLLKDVEKVVITKESNDSVMLNIDLSNPKYEGFKKNVTLKFPLNVEFNNQ